MSMVYNCSICIHVFTRSHIRIIYSYLFIYICSKYVDVVIKASRCVSSFLLESFRDSQCGIFGWNGWFCVASSLLVVSSPNFAIPIALHYMYLVTILDDLIE